MWQDEILTDDEIDNDPHRDDEALEGWIDAAQLVEAD